VVTATSLPIIVKSRSAFTMYCLRSPGLLAELRGKAMDKDYSSDHNMTTAVGLRCWLDVLAECDHGAGVWLGTTCSPFVSLCRNGHKRDKENGFWGVKKPFVTTGNLQMVACQNVLDGSQGGVLMAAVRSYASSPPQRFFFWCALRATPSLTPRQSLWRSPEAQLFFVQLIPLLDYLSLSLSLSLSPPFQSLPLSLSLLSLF
jgi:hypothetical protein